jgi:hypothetical protein
MRGTIPKTINKNNPGMRKSEKGEYLSISRDIFNIVPEGSMVRAPPPNIALIDRKKTRIKRI